MYVRAVALVNISRLLMSSILGLLCAFLHISMIGGYSSNVLRSLILRSKSPFLRLSQSAGLLTTSARAVGLCTSSLCGTVSNEPIFTPASEFSLPITDEEAELFQMFSSVVAELKEVQNIDCTVRVAGGWVRDKLLMTDLGATSSSSLSTHKAGPAMDIDIALDAMSGLQFAQALSEWNMRKEGGNRNSYEEKGDARDIPGYIKIGVIQQNPDKSKHLETATVQLGDFSIDFVNLRSETYTDSRIPEIAIGTPLEDAERRVRKYVKRGVSICIRMHFYISSLCSAVYCILTRFCSSDFNLNSSSSPCYSIYLYIPIYPCIYYLFIQDLTFNSLFYNVNTQQIEDYTGKGLDHLRQGLISTPLPALITLQDDPLRALRAVRFAARFHFSFTPGRSKSKSKMNGLFS